MSVVDTHNQGSSVSPVSPENEQLPVGKIVAVAIVSILAFAFGILWAVQIMGTVIEDNEREIGPRKNPTEIGKAEIGIVDQQLFAVDKRAVEFEQQKRARLEDYGWVSRKEQVIHIPIREAMKAVAEGRRAAAPIPAQNIQQPGDMGGQQMGGQQMDGGQPTGGQMGGQQMGTGQPAGGQGQTGGTGAGGTAPQGN